MGLSKDEWDVALKRLREAAGKVRADCQVLLTKHVGGEAGGRDVASEKEKECSGKVLVRQHPATVEEVIETRIAVVGNVDAGKYHAGCPCERRIWMMGRGKATSQPLSA